VSKPSGLRHRDDNLWSRSHAYRKGYHAGRMDEREDKMARPVLIQFRFEDGRVVNLNEAVGNLAKVGLKIVPVDQPDMQPRLRAGEVPTEETACRTPNTTSSAS
jgi:hypothetical protein